MRKATSLFMVVFAVMTVLVLTSVKIKTVKAANSIDYDIEYADHKIGVMYNGYIFINDTIRLVGKASGGAESLDRFLIGFPFRYGSYLLRCFAYNASNVFNVTLNIPLEDRMGFYAVEIRFPQPLDLSNETVHVFNVDFILSNSLLRQDSSDASYFSLDFPSYPSLTKPVASCNATIALPQGVTSIAITQDDEIIYTSNYTKNDLPAFTYSPATAYFQLDTGEIQLFRIRDLKSEVKVSEIGEIEVSDDYYITSETPIEMTAIDVILPLNASNQNAQDEFGRKMPGVMLIDQNTNKYKVSFASNLEGYRSTRFTVKYNLPRRYITQIMANSFNVTFPLFNHLNFFVEHASVTLVLPEGAKMSSFDFTLNNGACSIARSVFQETVTISRENISQLESILPTENVVQILYSYNPLWLAFRPTMWMWALAVVGCTIAVVWKRPKAPARLAVPTVAVRLRPEQIKSFVDTYEEKNKIILDMGSLESKVRKGKIPRHRYKVQKRTLETRLNTLTRNSTEFKEKMRTAGGQYAELMHQLEIAETEINEIEANIKSIESRHTRGELSLEAYRKLLADYQRRKEKANTTINGIILRLREELR